MWPKKVFPAPLPRKPNGDEQNKRKGNLPLFETGAFFFAPKNKLPVAARRETQFKSNCPMRAEGPREGYTANKAGRKEHAQAIRRRVCEQARETRRLYEKESLTQYLSRKAKDKKRRLMKKKNEQ